MDTLARLEAVEALKRLKARYFLHLDEKDWAAWRTVFADDAEMDVSAHFADAPDPSLYILRGADAIVAGVAAQLGETRTAHHGHTPILDVHGPDAASGIWALEDTLFMPDGARLTGFGHYHEDYRRAGDGDWRIWRTRLTRIGLVYSPPSATA